MPSSALAADDMTFLMIFAMVSMSLSFGGNVVLFDKKNCTPAWLHDYGLLIYTASLCVASVIWMREYVRTASSCVAT